MQEKWRKHLPYLEANVEKKTLQEMAEELNEKKEDLRLFLHRSRHFKVNRDDNLIIRLLTVKFTYPEYFTPTKQFFVATGIKQRRWWQLYKGEQRATGKELSAVVRHLKVNEKEIQGWLQLDLFENVL